MNPDKLPFVFDLSLADDLMDALLDQAAKDCSEHELDPVAICIVDAGKHLLCAKVMPGTAPMHFPVAQAKAFTAVTHKRNTITFEHAYHADDGWSSEPPLMNTELDTRWSASELANARHLDPTFCSLPGGTVIYGPDAKTVVGGVGIAGRKLGNHLLSLTRPWDWGV